MTFVKKKVKNCITGKETSSIKIPPFRIVESFFTMLNTQL